MNPDNEILNKIIAAYGIDSQMDMAIEEMAELTKALLKFRRAGKAEETSTRVMSDILENVMEEMADVQIMLDQLYLIFGEPVSQRKFKLERMKIRLKERSNDGRVE